MLTGIGMTIESDFYATEVNSAHKFAQLLVRHIVLVKLTDYPRFCVFVYRLVGPTSRTS